MKLSVTSKPDQAADDAIDNGLERHAEAFSDDLGTLLHVYCHDDDGRVIGGLRGDTGGGWFHIWQFWISEEHRGNGWGSRILVEAEEEAVRRGCDNAQVDTFSFQAPEFYLKHGYQQFAILEGYEGKYSRISLKKTLPETRSPAPDLG